MPATGARFRLAMAHAPAVAATTTGALCGLWWLLRETGGKSGSEEFNEAARPLLALL